jgi:hypothetical protein
MHKAPVPLTGLMSQILPSMPAQSVPDTFRSLGQIEVPPSGKGGQASPGRIIHCPLTQLAVVRQFTRGSSPQVQVRPCCEQGVLEPGGCDGHAPAACCCATMQCPLLPQNAIQSGG